jgi:hypothetical protein
MYSLLLTQEYYQFDLPSMRCKDSAQAKSEQKSRVRYYQMAITGAKNCATISPSESVVVFNLVLSGGKNGNYRDDLSSRNRTGSACVFLVDGEAAVLQQISGTMQQIKNQPWLVFLFGGDRWI